MKLRWTKKNKKRCENAGLGGYSDGEINEEVKFESLN